MNPFGSTTARTFETTIEQRRLHRGIFILPVLATIAILVPPMFIVVFFRAMILSLGLHSTSGSSPLSALWFFVLLIGALPGIVIFAVTWITYVNSEITLTDKHLLFRTGFFSRTSGELPLENVEALYLFEPLLGRILGYGTVTVTSIGGATFPLRYIGEPHQFHSVLQQAIVTAKLPGKPTPKSTVPASEDHSRYMPRA